jgi:dodecin
MTVARVTELSAVSDQSFEDAVNMAVNRATSTLRNVESAWVKDQNVLIENGNITGYKGGASLRRGRRSPPAYPSCHGSPRRRPWRPLRGT